jgi:hypothetical protein
VLNKKVKSLDKELELSYIQFENFFSDKLDCCMNSQKLFGDKSGVDFDKNDYIVKSTHVNKGEMSFTPHSCFYVTCPNVVNPDKDVLVENRPKVEDKGK